MDRSRTLLASLVLVASSAAWSQDNDARPNPASELAFNLHELIADAAEEIGKEIVVDPRLPPPMRAGYKTDGGDDYESLLAVLRLNGFIAVEKTDQVLILPAQEVRAEATRILNEDDSRVSDHEVVTRVITLPDFPPNSPPTDGEDSSGGTAFRPGSGAAALVPILRPLMPTNAMLGVVSNTNTLILVDRYDNVRRISAIIEEIVDSMQD